MATPKPEGNRRPGLFPRLLLRLEGFCLACREARVAAGKKHGGGVIPASGRQPETIGATKRRESVSFSAAI
jgi:hypothetical protein